MEILIVLIILLVVVSCIKVVPPKKIYITEVLGMYHNVWRSGTYFKIPFFEKIVGQLDTELQSMRFENHPIRFKNDMIYNLEFDLFYSISNPVSFYYYGKDPVSKFKNDIFATLEKRFGDVDISSLDDKELENCYNELG